MRASIGHRAIAQAQRTARVSREYDTLRHVAVRAGPEQRDAH